MARVVFPRVSYAGVSGVVVAVADKYCDSMGAFQVATIRTDDGKTVNVGNRYDTTHAFPYPYEVRPVLLAKWARKLESIPKDTIHQRALRAAIRERIRRVSMASF